MDMLVFSVFCFAYQLLNLREAPKLPGFFFNLPGVEDLQGVPAYDSS